MLSSSSAGPEDMAGPRIVLEALSAYQSGPTVFFLAGADENEVAKVLGTLQPATTLAVLDHGVPLPHILHFPSTPKPALLLAQVMGRAETKALVDYVTNWYVEAVPEVSLPSPSFPSSVLVPVPWG